MNNNNINISNDLFIFTEFLKETWPMIFNEENINQIMKEFEIWKENHTFIIENRAYIKMSNFDFIEDLKKAAAKNN